MAQHVLPSGLIDCLNKAVTALNHRPQLVQTTENVTECAADIAPEAFIVAIEHVYCKGLRLTPEVTVDTPPRYLVHMTVSP